MQSKNETMLPVHLCALIDEYAKLFILENCMGKIRGNIEKCKEEITEYESQLMRMKTTYVDNLVTELTKEKYRVQYYNVLSNQNNNIYITQLPKVFFELGLDEIMYIGRDSIAFSKHKNGAKLDSSAISNKKIVEKITSSPLWCGEYYFKRTIHIHVLYL